MHSILIKIAKKVKLIFIYPLKKKSYTMLVEKSIKNTIITTFPFRQIYFRFV